MGVAASPLCPGGSKPLPLPPPPAEPRAGAPLAQPLRRVLPGAESPPRSAGAPAEPSTADSSRLPAGRAPAPRTAPGSRRAEPQHRGQLPAPGGPSPSTADSSRLRAGPGAGAAELRPRKGQRCPAPDPAPCLCATVDCVLLAALCCSSTPLCREGRREIHTHTEYHPPLSRSQKRARSLFVFCGSGFTSLDRAWLQWCMSLQTPRCGTELERNLRSVTLWRGKINPIQSANPAQAFLPPGNQLYPPPNCRNSLLSSSLHTPSFGDCRMRHFLLSGSG
ncbi:PREDICTED: nascent polypeptide-associated complex subunit alpha, muscle-specific form-like [Nipponia nippon]|uniref:nascent polypeptide-associated complex subunit alpha, muscle-specific form-like n=1 Tax=Nipponia nippon TaxID=128390 RepID=UPI000511416E|nr:PREDICTED: nascent polypeptide-associated complex subunit alpha, muscle-specific form-like [Nipponia nippon]